MSSVNGNVVKPKSASSMLGTKKKAMFGGVANNGDDGVVAGAEANENGEKMKKEANTLSATPTLKDSRDKGKNGVTKALRDFIQRALMAEVAYYPESIIHFVQANDARIQQSVGSSAWTYTTHSEKKQNEQ